MLHNKNYDLMFQLLKKEEGANAKPVLLACEQMVNCLVENVMQLEGNLVRNRNINNLSML